MSPVSRRRKPAKKSISAKPPGEMTTVVRRYAPVFNSFPTGSVSFEPSEPWIVASALHDELARPDRGAGIDPLRLEKFLTAVRRLQLPGSGTMLLTLSRLQDNRDTRLELLKAGRQLPSDHRDEAAVVGRQIDHSLFDPEVVFAVELCGAVNNGSSFLLTLRAADSTFGILLHTLPDAIPRAPYSDGIVVTGGGVTTDPLNALTQLQTRADDQPTLWEVIEVSVADAAAELAEAMFCTDSYPQVCSDPHYWQSRRLIMMLLDNISEAAEYEQWQYGEDEAQSSDPY